jgi:hypothetical protein
LGLSPNDSDAWLEPDIVASFPPASTVIPVTHAPGQTSKLRLAAPAVLCSSVRKELHKGKSFAPSLLRAATQCLASKNNKNKTSASKPHRTRRHNEAYPTWEGEDAEDADSANQAMPEERFMDTDESGPTAFDPRGVKAGHEAEASDISNAVKDSVIQAHNRLGHPTRKTLLRMMRLGGSHPEAIKFAKIWKCPVCAAKQPPTKPMSTAANVRPYGFNHTVYMDLKFVQDIKGKVHAAVSIVCAGTAYHRAAVIKSKSPRYVARKVMRHWISQFGAPLKIVHDQGAEFERDFVAYLEDLSIHAEVTGSYAPWQLALGERHGGILGNSWQAVVHEHQCNDRDSIKLALDSALLAKNSTVTRNGFTANQAVFGHEPRDPTDPHADDDETNITALQAGGEVGRAAAMRHTAKMALLKLSVTDKLRRAMTRGPPSKTTQHEFLPGTRIYFWEPHPSKGRHRPDPGRWRGPALTLIREKHNRYFISWHGRLLLLAAENMRPASAEEAAAFDMVVSEAEAFSKEWQQEGPPEYEDRTNDPPPPAPPPSEHPESQMLKGLKSVRKLILKDKPAPKSRAKRLPARSRVPVTPEDSDDYAPTEAQGEYGPHAAEAPMTPEQSDGENDEEKFWQAVHEDEDNYVREDDSLTQTRRGIRSKMNSQQARDDAVSDVPPSIKRALELPVDDAPVQKKVKESLIAGIMASALDESQHANAWMNREEIRQLRRILGIPGITAARIHKSPRKKLERMPLNKKGKSLSRSRLSILIGHDAEDVYVLDEDPTEASISGTKKMPFLWKGITVFYQQKIKPKNVLYFQTPAGVAKAKIHSDDISFVLREIHEMERECRLRESFYLQMKQNGKELDPRHFDKSEKQAFDQSDKKEWESWLKNSSVEILDQQRARRVPKSKIFKLPLRFVRTNRATEIGKLIAKSRIVAPGHEDPGLGEFRTDAPTTDPLAVNLTKTVAVSLGWDAWIFDVETAFLSGKETDREIYVRAPKEGLPKTEHAGNVQPFSLLRVLKSIYGLTEAPRLWYLMAREVFEKCGYKELKMSKSTFVLVDEYGLTQSICNLHVDDGFLVGSPTSDAFKDAFSKLREHFNVKEWINLKEKEHKYLGVHTWQHPDGSITESMEKYVTSLKPIPVKRKDSDDRSLTAPEVKSFRSLVMQLRWPAQKMLTQVLYGVSYLAQKVNEAQVKHVKEANRLLKLALEEVKAGRAQITHHPVELGEVNVVTYFDASLGKEDGYKSQAGMVTFVTDARALEKMTYANRVEHQSKKITRVVKSSLAAESASLSMAVDKHLFARVLLQALMFGEERIGTDWRKDLTVGGYVVTDARALYDHITTTGSLPAERATMMDLLSAKEMVEQSLIVMRWVPTQHQYADHLTKTMVCELNKQYLQTGKICLIQTGADAEKEKHKAALRKAQRERRKERLKSIKGKQTCYVYRW